MLLYFCAQTTDNSSGTVREIFDSVISQIRALVDDQVRRVNDKEGRLPKVRGTTLP